MDAAAVMNRWLDAVESLDVEQITGMLADDFTMETETVRSPMLGKAMMNELLWGTLDAYESIRIDRRKIVASGSDAAVLVEMHVRFSKDMEIYGEKLSTRGRELDIMGALFAEVDEDGRIRRLMRVRDTLGVVQQLGLSTERVNELMRRFSEAMKKRPGRAA